MSQDGMFTQFLSIEYGNQKRLEQKLDEHLGIGNYEVVQRLGSQWKVMVKEELNEAQITDIRNYMRRRYKPTS
ncbi:hypothetical protein FNYG_10838 [Fusarium nygamai]|uniref:Uncharacterized protein n=1 Tax=Gibberella nygamai TaxID=42673 RepID=A0A2K0W0G0_GIBNY|nr:hypothetical protein FNYG_10838 [Fusarium nygamai]